MHRIDICRPTGVPLNPIREHDGRIVEAIIAEWATSRAGQPSGDVIEIDAIDSCRLLSGRGEPFGVLRHPCPFEAGKRPGTQAPSPPAPAQLE